MSYLIAICVTAVLVSVFWLLFYQHNRKKWELAAKWTAAIAKDAEAEARRLAGK